MPRRASIASSPTYLHVKRFSTSARTGLSLCRTRSPQHANQQTSKPPARVTPAVCRRPRARTHTRTRARREGAAWAIA